MISRVQSSNYQVYLKRLSALTSFSKSGVGPAGHFDFQSQSQSQSKSQSQFQFHRLNEMNHAKALKPLRDSEFGMTGVLSHNKLLDCWLENLGSGSMNRDRVFVNDGVRTGLNLLFQLHQHDKWLIPQDVYPVYKILASAANANRLSYYCSYSPTDADPSPSYCEDVTHVLSLEDDVRVVLITDPSPFGQVADSNLLGTLMRWLKCDPHRRLVIDGVYASEIRREVKCLLDTEQTYFLHSLSKTHALPLHYGMMLTPIESEVGTRSIADSSVDIDSNIWNSCTTNPVVAGQISVDQPNTNSVHIALHRIYSSQVENREWLTNELKLRSITYCVSVLRDMGHELKEMYDTVWSTVHHSGWAKGIVPSPNCHGSYMKIINGPSDYHQAKGLLVIPQYVYTDANNSPEEVLGSGDTYSVASILKQIEDTLPPFDDYGTSYVTRTMYHVTRLSNFCKGFDKYKCSYSKQNVKQSAFPELFHLLFEYELHVGLNKVAGSIAKHGKVQGGNTLIDQPLIIQTKTKHPLFISESGVAQYIKHNEIKVSRVGLLRHDGEIDWLSVEDVYAKSMKLIDSSLLMPFPELRPRSISILPVAQGCQAACSFCFSHASISADLTKKVIPLTRVGQVIDESHARGAERAVITGGGEPLMLPMHYILSMVKEIAKKFTAITMITNGYAISNRKTYEERLNILIGLRSAGLSVLSISRHGVSETNNTQIMQLSTNAERISETYNEYVQNLPPGTPNALEGLKLRWVCVLQATGVHSESSLMEYLDWVASTKVPEVCFKELYVASSEESLYFDHRSNQFSRENQVSLSLLTEFLEKHKAKVVAQLPWGCPIYRLNWKGHVMKVVAYTEPSVYWERINGICRSWNLMSDSDVYSSLETTESLLRL